MVIVSQDKRGIYNFDNIKSIDAIENEVTITDSIMSNRGVVTGKYKTEKRAKEVLQEIKEQYINSQMEYMEVTRMSREIKISDCFVYEMPEE